MKKNEFEKLFAPETMEIAILIDPSGFGAGRAGKEKYWTVNAGISAWQDLSSGRVHTVENCSLTTMIENTDELSKKLKANSILTVKVCKGEVDFLLKEVIESSDTYPELEKILEEQLKSVYYKDEILGTFTLDKSINYFNNKIEWLGESISVSFALDTEENIRDTISVLHNLVKEQSEWDRRVRKFAAEELTNLANDWQEEDVVEEEFAKRIILESITVYADGGFVFWFDDDDLFFGHVIFVEGNLKGDFERAEIAG